MSNAEHIILSVRDLAVQFLQNHQKVTAVNSISFTVRQGETLAIVGESGSGKSVTALSLVKLLPYPKAIHPSGQVLFKGQDLLQMPNGLLRKIRGKEIAYIVQEPLSALNPLHTIKKQIKEVLDLHTNLGEKEKEKRIVTLLEEVGFSEGIKRLNAYPHQLSGGQRQRIMIAMALAANPKILIADEPTTALDVTTQRQILHLLKRLQQKNKLTIIFITHDLAVVKYVADRVLVMRHGRIVEMDTKEQIFTNPKHPYTKELINAEPCGSAVLLKPGLPHCLSVDNLSVWFTQKKGFFQTVPIKTLNHIAFNLHPGETLGIVGESGSGKTTLAMALLRLNRLKEGKILLNKSILTDDQSNKQAFEIDLAQLNAKAMRPYRRDLQIVFQDPFASLSPRLSIEEIIAEGLDVHALFTSQTDRAQKITEVMKEVSLDPAMRHRYPHECSGGQRQRIALARVLILNPKILILDEPTSALDRIVQTKILDLLKKLQQTRQLSYIFISHDLKVVQSIAHRILVMQSGRILEQGTAEEILKNPTHPYTKELVKAALLTL